MITNSDSILSILTKLTHLFKHNSIPNPDVEAAYLISHVTTIPHLELSLYYTRILTSDEAEQLDEYVNRRLNREPLQYILGETEFFGLLIKLTPDVLIPRPETELLVERIIKDSISYSNNSRDIKLLDLCTGSGCIAIALKNQLPTWKIEASDISEAAVSIAKSNAKSHCLDITFYQSNLFEDIPEPESEEDRYDFIVSNPPYISEEEYPTLQPEITNYEPKQALIASESGLFFYKQILQGGKRYMKKGGMIYFEIGSEQKEAICNIALKLNYKIVDTLSDYQHLDRIIVLKQE